METELLSVSDIVVQKVSLKELLQQCNHRNHYNPKTQFKAWVCCLNEVQQGQSYQYTALDFAKTIPQVWNTSGKMSRDILFRGIKGILTAQGKQAFIDSTIYQAVNIQYPVTVDIVIDSVALMNAHGNNAGGLFNASPYVKAYSDNGDPNQGSNEITIYANIGNMIVWIGKSKNGTDSVELTEFIKGDGTDLFGDHPPTRQSNGSFKGTLTQTGHETYHFNFKVNNGSTIYWWDPFIQSNA